MTTPTKPTQSIWTRWWMIAIYVIAAFLLAAAIFSGGRTPDEGDVITAETVTTMADSSTTSSTEAATTTTTVPPFWEPFTVDGSGDNFFEYTVPNGDAAVLEISHTGLSNFAVWTYDSDNEPLDLLVNTIGNYSGDRPVNFLVDETVAFLEITADGSWEVTAHDLASLPIQDQSASGVGDDVVVLNLTSPQVTLTHNGESNFAIWAWTFDEVDLLVNEIGPYSGTVRSPNGGFVVYDITADGDWTVNVG